MGRYREGGRAGSEVHEEDLERVLERGFREGRGGVEGEWEKVHSVCYVLKF